MSRDMKAGLGKKAPLAHVPPALLTYAARAHEYGAEKYELGNYLREPPEGQTDVGRLLGYISATQRHLVAWADSIIRQQGGGRWAAPDLHTAIYAEDDESGLPHGAHAAASLGMALQQAVDAGLLPADPKSAEPPEHHFDPSCYCPSCSQRGIW